MKKLLILLLLIPGCAKQPKIEPINCKTETVEVLKPIPVLPAEPEQLRLFTITPDMVDMDARCMSKEDQVKLVRLINYLQTVIDAAKDPYRTPQAKPLDDVNYIDGIVTDYKI